MGKINCLNTCSSFLLNQSNTIKYPPPPLLPRSDGKGQTGTSKIKKGQVNLDWLTSVDPLICKIQRADLHKVTGKSKGPIVTSFLYLQRCVHWAPHIILFVLPLGNNHETFVVCNLLLSLVT